MTLRELKFRTVPNLIFFNSGDPAVIVRMGRLLDSKIVNLARMNTKPSTFPWGYERMSRESRRG